MRRLLFCSACMGLLFTALIPLQARSFRVNQIPNGSVNGCLNCHVSATGGATNSFGRMVQAGFLVGANVNWTPLLAMRDADGDNVRNGVELQDGYGRWEAGQAAPGNPSLVTNPGNPGQNAAKKLTVNFAGMTPHIGQTIEIRVSDKGTTLELDRYRVTVTAATFSAERTMLITGRSYWVEFYADVNRNGIYDPPPTDASWRLEANAVAGDTVLNFAYHTNFAELRWDYVLTLRLQGMTPHLGQLLEVQVIDLMTRITAMRTRVEFVTDPAFAVSLPGIKLGRNYRVDFYADHNGNGLYDAPPVDHAWRRLTGTIDGHTIINFTHNTDFTPIGWDYLLMQNFVDMRPHLGQLFEDRIVDGQGVELFRHRIVNVPVEDFTIFTTGVKLNTPYRLDFFADHNNNLDYDKPPADHAWSQSIPARTTGDVVVNFIHNTNFNDISWPPMQKVYFPRLRFVPGMWTEGIGFVNTGAADALVRFTSYNSEGAVARRSDTFLWPGRQQGALQSEQILELFLPVEAWILGETNQPGMVGFFLSQFIFNGELVGMDGAEMISDGAVEGVFPRIKETANFDTELYIINPGISAVQVSITGFDGRNAHNGGTHSIPGRGFMRRGAASFFSTVFDGYMRVRAEGGRIIGHATIRDGNVSVASINMLPLGGAAEALNGSHVLSWPMEYYSELNLINPGANTANATITILRPDGTPYGSAIQRAILPGQILALSDADLGMRTGSKVDGWLRVASPGQPLLGCLTFGSPVDNHYSSTLPLQANPASELYFAQVANGRVGTIDYFTGLSMVNPNESPVQATVEVYSSDGRQFGQNRLTLPPRTKFVRLLSEIIPGLPDQGSGYVKITTQGGGVFAFAIFGDSVLNFLSAVPAQLPAK